MTSYCVTIVGMVVLSAAANILLPSGRMCSFVRSIIALFLFFVIVNPIITFAKAESSFFNFVENIENVVNSDISQKEVEALKSNIKKAVKIEYDVDCNVEIYYENNNGVAQINKVVLLLEKFDDLLNSNSTKRIADCVLSVCGDNVEVVVGGK